MKTPKRMLLQGKLCPEAVVLALAFALVSVLASCQTSGPNTQPNPDVMNPDEWKTMEEFRQMKDNLDRSEVALKVEQILWSHHGPTAIAGNPFDESSIVVMLGQPDEICPRGRGQGHGLAYRMWTKGGEREYLVIVLLHDAFVGTERMTSLKDYQLYEENIQVIENVQEQTQSSCSRPN